MSTNRIQVEARASARRCAVCHDRLGRGDASGCPECGTVLHLACVDDLERCPTLACRGRPVLAPRFSPLDRVALAGVGGALLAAAALVPGLLLGAGEHVGGVRWSSLDEPVLTLCLLGAAGGALVQTLQERVAHRTSRALTYGPYLLLAPLLVPGVVVGVALGRDGADVQRVARW